MFHLANVSNHSEVKQTYVHMQEFPGFILQKAGHIFMLARTQYDTLLRMGYITHIK